MIPWLDHVEFAAERTGISLVDVGFSKLLGLTLDDINAICKNEGLTWYKFCQVVTEWYLDIPYESECLSCMHNLCKWMVSSLHVT